MGYWTNYPFHVFLILANEFCERFSYYGMRAVLVFFLWKGLGFEEAAATSIYHTFVVLCYLSPLFGAMIADGWLGKYKTILYISIIYAIGNVLMTVSALSINGSYTSWVAFIGLVVIGFGTGGIKPCVSSFGGDQFKEGQVKQKESFFSLFYLTINIGSTISTIVIPFLRGNVYCFNDNCYALCFGIPAILMGVSILLFVSGTKWYVKHPAGDSILKKFFDCIWTALVRKCSCSKNAGKAAEHWLDLAAPTYEQDFIEDVKDVMRVAWLFIPLPVFWALFDMQGSKWILQAQQMNGDFNNITVYPDMIHFLNPLLVVILVPLLEYVVYPCLDKIKVPNRPLQRMGFGMVLATVAFLITGFLQLAINGQQPTAIATGQTKFQVINTSPHSLQVEYGRESLSEVLKLEAYASSGDYIHVDEGTYLFKVTHDGAETTSSHELQGLKAYQLFVTVDATSSLTINTIEQKILKKTSKGESTARIFNSLSSVTKVTLKNQNTEPVVFKDIQPGGTSAEQTLIAGSFKAFYTEQGGEEVALKEDVFSKNGALYALFLTRDPQNNIVLKQLTEIEAWGLNIFLQTPQYVVMALAETLFSVTGLAFAYTQAPLAMKSILTAIWLLTVCVGNIIIILIQGVSTSMDQAVEFFMYTGLMAVTTVAFLVMSLFYTYVTPRGTNTKEADIDIDQVKFNEPPVPEKNAFNHTNDSTNL